MSAIGWMHGAFGVVLDTNVLYPPSLRDTLLRAAEQGLYRLHWSDEILEELRRNLISDGDVSEIDARDLIETLRDYFPEAAVTDYASLLDAMGNDPKDRHVLAAAVRARADIIVTVNIKDFPAAALGPFNIKAHTPDVS